MLAFSKTLQILDSMIQLKKIISDQSFLKIKLVSLESKFVIFFNFFVTKKGFYYLRHFINCTYQLYVLRGNLQLQGLQVSFSQARETNINKNG